jgi:hypothetical protein
MKNTQTDETMRHFKEAGAFRPGCKLTRPRVQVISASVFIAAMSLKRITDPRTGAPAVRRADGDQDLVWSGRVCDLEIGREKV